MRGILPKYTYTTSSKEFQEDVAKIVRTAIKVMSEKIPDIDMVSAQELKKKKEKTKP